MSAENKNILIVGGGGREHAIGLRLRQDSASYNLYFAKGNAGTTEIGENLPIDPAYSASNYELVRFAQENYIDLTIIGPEDSLAMGIVDLFRKYDLNIFGPTKEAAELESSKSRAVEFMRRHNIPHANSAIFPSYELSKAYIENYRDDGIVVKADGLAQGKGVFVCDTKYQAQAALKNIMIDRRFDNAGDKVVLQEKLQGREISVLAFTDGKIIKRLPVVRDHKTFYPGGPNTGGVATFAPVNLSEQLLREINERFLYPTINGMQNEGKPYQGVLFFGLMLTKDGPKALEINCRFGDPETQVLMMLLKSRLLPVLESCTDQTLDQQAIVFTEDSAACVVLASDGYPGNYTTDIPIHGLENSYGEDIVVSHAGTKRENGQTVTAGGRVLGITARAPTAKQAFEKSLSAIGDDCIHFAGMQCRKEFNVEE